MFARNCLLISAVCLILASCNTDERKSAITSITAPKPALMEPFRFHKAIEVAPGQTYDVLSWGRGATAAGAFAILHSDSANIKYTTTTGDLDGTITDVYNADMDVDGNPEILIQAKGKDTINYTKIYAYEFKDNQANKLDFPKLSNSQKKGYRGDDNFYIRDGKLIREFPVYDGNTTGAKATGQKRQLEYSLRSNNFTVQQLNKDSTSAKTDEPVVKHEVKKTVAAKNTSKKSKPATTKKKKRRRS